MKRKELIENLAASFHAADVIKRANRIDPVKDKLDVLSYGDECLGSQLLLQVSLVQ